LFENLTLFALAHCVEEAILSEERTTDEEKKKIIEG
jgi:hypothetical protein